MKFEKNIPMTTSMNERRSSAPVAPHVEDQQRHGAVADVALVVVDLRHDQALADRLPRQRPPTGALNVERRFGQLALEAVEGAERLLDCRRQLARRLPAAARTHVAPEE